jgi:hypothetical protein
MPKLASVGRQTILAAANLDSRQRQVLRSDVIAKDSSRAALPPRRCCARSSFERPRNKGGAANCGLSLMKLPPDHNSRLIRPRVYCVWKIFEWKATTVSVVFAITLAWK